MIQRRHKILIIVWFAFVFTLMFKAFPKDEPANHIPFASEEVLMRTKTWVYLGSIHVSISLLLFALIIATYEDKELRKLLYKFVALEVVSLIDYLLTYNADFWMPEFDSNLIKFVIYSILIGWIIFVDIRNFLRAKHT